MKDAQLPGSAAGRTRSWWAAFMAGQVDEPHPMHGADLDVAFKGGVLRLSGELQTEEERKSLVEEAGEYVGRGIAEVDAKHLTVAKRTEMQGLLDQTLIAAFADLDVAEFARAHLIESRGVKPRLVEVLDSKRESKARELLPSDFVSEVQKAFKAGEAVLVLRVDETAAFRARELLAQETRSLWTIATPPIPSPERGR